MSKLYKLKLLPYKQWLKNASLLIFLFAFAISLKAQTTCQAGFTYTIANNEVSFKNTSSNSANNQMKYFWNFGDDQINYDGVDMKHRYFTDGAYIVTLNAYDTVSNCHSVFTDTVVYKFISGSQNCNALFNVNIDHYNLSTQFAGVAPGQYQKYSWDFGDSTIYSSRDTAAVYKVEHTYKSYGSYTVCLIVSDSVENCADTFCRQIVISKPINNDSCKAYFDYTNTSGTVYFNSYASCRHWAVSSYFWHFGDGDTSHAQSPIHTYTIAGKYKVMLVVRGTGSAIPDTLIKTVEIASFCRPNYRLIRYKNDLEIGFGIKQMPSSKFQIDFGDGTVIDTFTSDTSVIHTYAKAGVYQICYKVNDTFYNCRDSICFNLTVFDPVWCYAGFKAFVGDFSRNITLLSDSMYAGRDSSFFEWDFGDGIKESGLGKSTVFHTYAKDSTYTVTLKTTNTKNNCTDTSSRIVKINSNPQPGSVIGNVYLDASNLADSAFVYLIQVDDSITHTLIAVDSAVVINDTTSSCRVFRFYNIPPGRYMVKAALARSSQYYQIFFPTYYGNVLKWNDAHAIYFQNGYNGTQYASIHLKIGKNLGGPGFIGGKISAGANKKEGDPLQDIQVMLFDASKEPVTYTYSDAEGNFKFENLALGTYEVYTEVMGLKTNSAFVALSENTPKVDNVQVKVSSNGISTSIKSWLSEDFISQPKLYPNPAKNTLYLQTDLRKSQNADLIIYNITGQEIYREKTGMQQGNQTHSINTEKLPAGPYILMLKNASGENLMQGRFMKY